MPDTSVAVTLHEGAVCDAVVGFLYVVLETELYAAIAVAVDAGTLCVCPCAAALPVLPPVATVVPSDAPVVIVTVDAAAAACMLAAVAVLTTLATLTPVRNSVSTGAVSEVIMLLLVPLEPVTTELAAREAVSFAVVAAVGVTVNVELFVRRLDAFVPEPMVIAPLVMLPAGV